MISFYDQACVDIIRVIIGEGSRLYEVVFVIRSESKRSFCAARKNNKMAAAVRLPRRREGQHCLAPQTKFEITN